MSPQESAEREVLLRQLAVLEALAVLLAPQHSSPEPAHPLAFPTLHDDWVRRAS